MPVLRRHQAELHRPESTNADGGMRWKDRGYAAGVSSSTIWRRNGADYGGEWGDGEEQWR